MTPVTIEITPTDASWQSASEMIEHIKRKNPEGYKLSFVVKECFRVERNKDLGDNIVQINNTHAVGKNVFMN